nr:putative ribonuclease H-like domain-containing protein [Tanacetum cinerariifolium]
MDKCKTGLGYNAVPPPYTGNSMPPKPNVVYPSLDNFVDVNEFISESIVEKPTVVSNEPKTVGKENGAPIIEDRTNAQRIIKKFNGGFVAFGGNSKGRKITMKDFKLTDESHVFLKVPRKDNMYNVDLKNVIPQGGLTYLFKKAKSDEYNLWHRRLRHINTHIDNESTICIVKNPVFHSKTKHIEIRHHFIRDSNKKKLIQMIKIHTDQNVVDFLIKAFDVSRFQYMIAIIGMLTSKVLIERKFMATAKAKIVNEEAQIHAKVDGKKVIFYEATIRRDLKFKDEGGVDFLSNQFIFEQLTLMGTMASAIICLAINQKFNFSKYIFECMKQQKPGKSKRKDTQETQPSDPTINVANEALNEESVPIHSNDPLRVKRLEKKKRSRTHRLKRLYKVGLSARVESSNEESLGEEDASKQGRKIADIVVAKELTLVDETTEEHGRLNDQDEIMFD